jgi:hypothetical protein
MNRTEPNHCALRLTAEGRTEPCPRERCAFWEPGGAVVEGACLIERLHVDLRRHGVAAYLLETRGRLERCRDLAEAEQAHRDFARRIGYEL